MAGVAVLMLLLFAGTVVGYIIGRLIKKMEKTEAPFVGGNFLQFLAETMYFAMLLSVPLSGNLIISLIILAIFVYALFGGYGIEQLEPLKPEDKVDSKWFPKYP